MSTPTPLSLPVSAPAPLSLPVSVSAPVPLSLPVSAPALLSLLLRLTLPPRAGPGGMGEVDREGAWTLPAKLDLPRTSTASFLTARAGGGGEGGQGDGGGRG